MTLRSKVAALLAIGFLALPLASLTACVLHRPLIDSKPTHCQMTAHRGAGVLIKGARSKTACCELNSSAPFPASKAQVVTEISERVFPWVVASNFEVASTHMEQDALRTPAPVSGRDLQAILCVLLI